MALEKKPYYISTECIKAAYSELCAINVSNASILHIYFILKACGTNKTTYELDSNIADLGFDSAYRLSILFTPYEKAPDSHDFINPFDMKDWSGSDEKAEQGKAIKKLLEYIKENEITEDNLSAFESEDFKRIIKNAYKL